MTDTFSDMPADSPVPVLSGTHSTVRPLPISRSTEPDIHKICLLMVSQA